MQPDQDIIAETKAASGARLDAIAETFGVPPRDVVVEMTGDENERADDAYRKRVMHRIAGLPA
jgi:hypothetical protein